jgi:hypothetical protein
MSILATGDDALSAPSWAIDRDVTDGADEEMAVAQGRRRGHAHNHLLDPGRSEGHIGRARVHRGQRLTWPSVSRRKPPQLVLKTIGAGTAGPRGSEPRQASACGTTPASNAAVSATIIALTLRGERLGRSRAGGRAAAIGLAVGYQAQGLAAVRVVPPFPANPLARATLRWPARR